MLVFLIVAVVSTAALAWLTFELFAQDRTAAAERAQEAQESATDAAVRRLQGTLGEIAGTLAAANPVTVPPPVAGSVVIRYADGAFVIEPPGGVLYVPRGIASSRLDASSWLDARRLAQAGDFEEAAALYRGLLNSGDPGARGTALLRLARVQRLQGAWSDALATYDLLEPLDNTGVDGYAARLAARLGRLAIFERDGPDAGRLRSEAAALGADLAAGRLHVTRGQFDHFSAEVSRWLGVAISIDEDARARSEALYDFWTTREERPPEGFQLVTTQRSATFLAWSQGPADDFRVLILGPKGIAQMLDQAVARYGWSVEVDGEVTAGRAVPARGVSTRTAANTGLPWTLHVFANPDTPLPTSSRRKLLIFVLVCVGLLLAAGWYFISRGVSREVRVARMQSDFVSAVSHEFRSPLTSLQHLTELLAGDRIPSAERRAQAYHVMMIETQRLSRLVESLLEFGRLQAGHTAMHVEPTNVSDLVRTITADFGRRLHPGAAPRIDVTLDAPAASSAVDREAFGRVIWNLLDNAVKYSPGTSPVEVRVAQRGDRIAISVQDHGLGIPVAEQARVFDRFMRGAEALSNRIGGTGIGLAMAREIVQAHGGDISVQSQPGSGSTFTVVVEALKL